MDAAYTSLKKTASFLALALLISAAASAQPAFILNGGNNATSITLVANQSTAVSVVSSTAPATQITYMATVQYQNGDLAWLCLNNPLNTPCDTATAQITPNNLFVLVGQNAADLSIGTHSATVTLTATDGSGAGGTITVTYTTNSFQSGGGNGALTANPSAPSISAGYGAQTTLSFQLITTSASSVSFSLTQPSVPWATNFLCSGVVSGGVASTAPATCTVAPAVTVKPALRNVSHGPTPSPVYAGAVPS